MRYFFTPSARTDLEEIWCYIAEDNVDAADALEADIYNACEFLITAPEAGSCRPKWTDKPVRFFVVRRNYLIVYRAQDNSLEVLRIFHGARDIPKLLGDQ
jgi:toxin ParE1/3/4